LHIGYINLKNTKFLVTATRLLYIRCSANQFNVLSNKHNLHSH